MNSKWEGMENYLTQAGATTIGAAIRDFWNDIGYRVTITYDTIADHKNPNRPVIFCVRTDLVDGLPKDFRQEDAAKVFAAMRAVWPKRAMPPLDPSDTWKPIGDAANRVVEKLKP